MTFCLHGRRSRIAHKGFRARIHKSVKTVLARAFEIRLYLSDVEFHNEIEIIEMGAFFGCTSLSGSIKLLGVKVVKKNAFNWCAGLTDVEFGDKLETIEGDAFINCIS